MKLRFLNRRPIKRKFPTISTLYCNFQDYARIKRFLYIPLPEFAKSIRDKNRPLMSSTYGPMIRFVRDLKDKNDLKKECEKQVKQACEELSEQGINCHLVGEVKIEKL